MRYRIGIDPGTKTGVCIWDQREKKIAILKTTDIESAMFFLSDLIAINPDQYRARVENPSARGGRKDWLSPKKAQGAGSVKRDFAIWKSFFERRNVPMEALTPSQVHSFKYRILGLPKGASEKDFQAAFKALTGMSSSSHAREAAVMVINI